MKCIYLYDNLPLFILSFMINIITTPNCLSNYLLPPPPPPPRGGGGGGGGGGLCLPHII